MFWNVLECFGMFWNVVSSAALAGESASLRRGRIERVAADALSWLRGKAGSERPEKKLSVLF
jgi:hypothetical protein